MENLPGFENLLGFGSNYVLSEYIGSYRPVDFLEEYPRPKFQIPRLKGGGRTLMTLIFMIMDDLFLRRIVEIWFDMQDACMGKRSRMMRLTRGKCQFKSKTPKRLLLPLNLKVLPIQGVLFPSHPKELTVHGVLFPSHPKELTVHGELFPSNLEELTVQGK